MINLKLLFVSLGFLAGASSLPGAFAADIVVKVPAEIHVASAQAKPLKMKMTADGAIDGDVIRFKNLLPDVAYDVKLTLADGTVLQGINLGWHDMEPAKADAGELSDDDRNEITDILKKVLSFFNKNDIVLLNGDHDRATALVQLVRDNGFHSNSGDEVIWRMELWYYKNQHGGWEKVQQAAEVVRRERFASHQEYQKTIDHLRWTPELGGLKVRRDGRDLTVTLPANAGTLSSANTATTQAVK